MKRVVKIALVLVLVMAGTSFAAGRPKTFGLTAIGAYGSFGYTGTAVGGIGLSLKFGSFPVIGLKYDFSEPARIGASVDWYILDSLGLVGACTYFLGVGGAVGLVTGTSASVDFALRGNIGLQVWPVDLLELYLDLIPTLNLFPRVTPGVGLELGLRFHF